MVNNYEALLQRKAKMPDVAVIQNDIASADTWDEAYWIGKYVFEQASGLADKLIMDAYEKAFGLGLNIRVDRECFLIATQQIAKIYFQFRKFDQAINMLMVLDSNVDHLPDWVNLYYASAQIHTENVLYWAEVPEMLFRRIDGIDEEDEDSVRRRKFLFLEFLNRLSEISKTRSLANVNKDAILAKAGKLGIAESRECLNFKVAVGLLKELPSDAPQNQGQNVSGTFAGQLTVYQELVDELNKKLSELQAIIDKQNITMSRQREQSEDQQKQIVRLQADLNVQENSFVKQAEELKVAKENEYELQAKCRALESQLSGSETTKRLLEENAAVISELQVDVEDLKTALSVTKRNNEKLHTEIQQDQDQIEQLRVELLQSQEHAQTLQATIDSQQVQLEVAEAAVKTAQAVAKEAEEKAAAAELAKPSSATVPTEPEETSTPLSMLDILSVDNFLPRKQKILIIGGSETKENHLRGKLKSMGFDFSKEQLEFELEYENVKDYASRIKPWSGKYAGIIVGPCPHKAKDIDGYSSFIEKIRSEEGYPHVEEARDKSGALKISNTSIGDAMLKMAVYLQSIA